MSEPVHPPPVTTLIFTPWLRCLNCGALLARVIVANKQTYLFTVGIGLVTEAKIACSECGTARIFKSVLVDTIENPC